MGIDYHSAGPARRLMRVVVTLRPVAWMSARVLPTLDRLAFDVTGGRVTPSAMITGLPVIQVTTIGARSGRPRTVRVLGIPEADGLLLVAANFGDSRNPAWYYNIQAKPRVTVADGHSSREYDAHELTGDEREVGFDLALALNPGWRRFLNAAGARDIPVVRLTPADR